MMSETEWSQHKKLIDFSARPGGFRRAMVPNLPYFMVQFDYKGEKGYGHVIEGTSEASGNGEEDVDEGEKGGGEFPRWVFAILLEREVMLMDATLDGLLGRSSETCSISSRVVGEGLAELTSTKIRRE